jgi:ATP-dependent Clp protease ATP-binding subunit ClpC
VGKTAVVEGLACKISCGAVPPSLKNKTIYALDIPSIIAGAKYRGEFEERMKSVMRECIQNPDVILFIDEIHTIIGAGGAEGAIDAANILKPALARGEIRIIGATTVSEYRKHIEKDSALERRFQPILINEPSESETIKILCGLRDRYESHHGIKISDEAIEGAVTLSQKYINDRFLPDKAIDLIDEAASRVKIKFFLKPSEAEELERELIPKELYEVFEQNYLNHPMKYRLKSRKIYEESENGRDYVHFKGIMKIGDNDEVKLKGTGNGPIDAFFNALKKVGLDKYEFINYSQHAISHGSDSRAVSYIELKKPDGNNIFGIGIDSNVNVASVLGVLNAINRAEA